MDSQYKLSLDQLHMLHDAFDFALQLLEEAYLRAETKDELYRYLKHQLKEVLIQIREYKHEIFQKLLRPLPSDLPK